MNIAFRDAVVNQADLLSDLAIKSKGHWGYPQTQLEIWRKDLRVEKSYIQENLVQTVSLNGELAGFFAIKHEDEGYVLDHLWLLPDMVGRGLGRLSFQRIEKLCMDAGIIEFTIVADPNAEGFYLAQGAVKIGEVESVPQGRMLPKLRYRISQNQTAEQVVASNG